MPIHHLAFSSVNLKKSKNFYCALLNPMGYEVVLDQDEIVAIDGPDFELLLYKVKDEYLKFEHKIYQPGFHHLAIKVSGRDVVEASYEAVASIGATVLEGPKEFKNYPGNYFAFFVLDPDGLKIEIMTN